jgi:hypothetical protein
LYDSTSQTGVLLRRDLNPDYVDASIQDHLFCQVAPTTGSSSFIDLGAFSSGPGLDVTYGWYGATMHVDVSKDGGALLHREVDTTLLPTSMSALIVSCGADITIDDVLAGPL